MDSIQQGQFSVQPPSGLTEMMGGPSALTGGIAMQREGDYRQNMGMQQLINDAINKRNNAMLEEFARNKDLRELQKQAEMAKARGTATNAEAMAGAERGLKEDELARRRATQAGDIEAAQAGNKGKIDIERVKQAERDVEEMYRHASQIDDDSPTAMADMMKWMDNAGIKESSPMRKAIGQSRSASEMKARIGAIRERIIRDAATTRKVYEEGTIHSMDNEAKQKVAETNAAASRYHSDAMVRAAQERPGPNPTAASAEVVMRETLANMGDRDTPETPEERQAVQWGVEKARKSWDEHLRAEGPLNDATSYLSGKTDEALQKPKAQAYQRTLDRAKGEFAQTLPPAVSRQFSGKPAAAGPRAAPKKGDVVKGFTFLGGDPSKKENWKK